jgi:hypothetical protein
MIRRLWNASMERNASGEHFWHHVADSVALVLILAGLFVAWGMFG